MEYNKASIVHLSPEYLMGGFTAVDNIFICEYLKNADENAVKVYLYGLYLAHSGVDTDENTFTTALNLTKEELQRAFEELEAMGVCDITGIDPLSVVFRSISNSPVKPRKIKSGKYDEFNKELFKILSNRMLSPNELMECYNVIELYHIQPEAFLLIASYCVKVAGERVGIKYILTTAKNFAYKNVTTIKAVEEELSAYHLQTGDVAEVIKRLGLKKKVDIEDNNTYKKWLSMGFDKAAVLAAANGVKKESNAFKKLDLLMSELYSYKLFSEKEITDFIESKKDLKNLAIEINKALGVFLESLDAEISTYIVKWIACGFERDLLVKLADFCFKSDIRTLSKMDETVAKFAKLGVFTSRDFDEYVAVVAEKDKLVQQMVDALDLSRKVNSFDRKQYKAFEGIATHDVIIYAASLAKTANSPYAYLSKLLTSFKEQGLSSVEEIKRSTVKTTQKSDNTDMLRHNYSKQDWEAVYTSIEDLDL